MVCYFLESVLEMEGRERVSDESVSVRVLGRAGLC